MKTRKFCVFNEQSSNQMTKMMGVVALKTQNFPAVVDLEKNFRMSAVSKKHF